MDSKKSLEMYGYEENFIDQKSSKKARYVASEPIIQEDLRGEKRYSEGGMLQE